MRVKDIFGDAKTKVFVVTNQESDNELNWTIESTNFELIPDEEGLYLVKAKQIIKNNILDCFLIISTPERIAETIIKKNIFGICKAEDIIESKIHVIPAIASECFGVYELFYVKENPQIGINILEEGLNKATNKNVVAEDLGYILRDEGRIKEAIEAFKVSEQFGPSSEYIYLELSQLYESQGQQVKQIEYKQKFKDNGGIE